MIMILGRYSIYREYNNNVRVRYFWEGRRVHCDGVDAVSEGGESAEEELMCSTGGSYFSDSGGGRTSSAAADSAIATPSGSSSSSSIISKEKSFECRAILIHAQLTFGIDLRVLSEAILHVLELFDAVYTLRFVLRVDKARESFAELWATRSMSHST